MLVTVSGSNAIEGSSMPTSGIGIVAANQSGLGRLVRTVNAVGDSDDGQRSLAVGSSVYNGATFDRWRNNTQGTLLASADRTATTSSPVQTNHNARGIIVFLRLTAASGTGGLVVTIEGQDPASGNTGFQLNISPTAITAVGLGKFVFELYPGISGVGGAVSQRTNGTLPRNWRAIVNHMDSSSYTYSLGYALIL